MAKAEPKTKPTEINPAAFVAAVEHPGRRADAETLLALYRDVTGLDPVMWGPSMIGYGTYRYETKSCAGDWPRAGFSPRKANLAIYLMGSYQNVETQAPMEALRAQLGKHKMGASCLTITRLADVEIAVLGQMIARDLAWMDANHPRQ